jgi:hypothetical protein
LSSSELFKPTEQRQKVSLARFSLDCLKPLERVSKRQLGASWLIPKFALCLTEIDRTRVHGNLCTFGRG